MKYICDTNIVIRYIRGELDAYEGLHDIMRSVQDGHIHLVIEQTIFIEVIFVLISCYNVPKTRIIASLMDFLAFKGVETERELLSLSLDYYLVNNLDFADCLVIAKSNLSGIPILSLDKKLNTIANKMAINK